MQHHTTEEKDRKQRGSAAVVKIQMGQVSRGRQCLTGVVLASKTEDTYNLSEGRRPLEQVRPIPEEVLDFRPEASLRLKKTVFSRCLREAPSGSSSGLGG